MADFIPIKELNHTIYLAFGTNLGDRRANLKEALERMRAGGSLHLVRLSHVYETAPVGFNDQPHFLNLVAEARTAFTPLELLSYVKQVEALMGRETAFVNGPRLIDIDILFYDDQIVKAEKLEIPHPRMGGRGFVFVPLAEIAPGLVHPVSGQTTTELLDEINLDAAGIKLFEEEFPLEVPPPRFLLVSGRLAGPFLEDILGKLAERLNFQYQVKELPIDVAAFMTVKFIADKLTLAIQDYQKLNLIIIPGWAGGDPGLIEAACKVQAVRGPTEINELEPFISQLVEEERAEEEDFRPPFMTEEQLRALHQRVADPNIRIFTDGQKIYAFNHQVFASGGTSDKEVRQIFRQLHIIHPGHAFYLGKELGRAALSIRLGKPFYQDRDFPL